MLKATNLRKEYGSLVAVNDVDFTIETGEFATIVGPSGCGKTTLLRMLGGHLEPTGGVLELDDSDITYTSPQERPTSLVFQSWALFPHMTVRENIEFPIEAQGLTPKDEVDELLTQVRLDPEEYAEKKPDELSGGQQQRVALARSLAYDPDILLLDEPLASLDYVLQKRLQRELADLNKELDMTFIYVTHSLESALVMSDRLFVLQDGEIVQTGPPEDIYRKPTNKFIAEFMGDANVFPISSSRVDEGTVRVESDVFERDATVEYSGTEPPEYLVIRHDDCVTEPSMTHDMGIPATVENILVKGNNALVEVVSPATGEEYVSEMSLDRVNELGVGIDDEVYLQWDANKAIPVPE